MELTWVNKVRVAAVAALGIVVIGILAWPLAAPDDPMLPVRAWNVGAVGTIVLLAMAFAVGLAGYFIAWPHGREIGILGVPFGLIVWAGRSGSMRTLTQAMDEPAERAALLQSLRFEPVYWLAVIAAGFAGVLVARQLSPDSQPAPDPARMKAWLKPTACANAAIALIVSTIVAIFFTGVFAQDLSTSYNMVYAQPQIGQIVFGITAAFAVAAFVVKKFLDLSYLWPAVASIFVLPLAQVVFYGPRTIQTFAESRPATFYPHAIFAILPLQLTALGALGSVLGFWLAVRYNFWRKHESAG